MSNKAPYPTPDLFVVVPDDDLPPQLQDFRKQLPPGIGNFYYANYNDDCIAFCWHKKITIPTGAEITIVVPMLISIDPGTELRLKLQKPIGPLH